MNGLFKKRSFILFLVVGGINTAFGYSVFAVLTLLGFHYSLAALLSTILGIAFNFLTTGKIVFGNQSLIPVVRFLIAYGIYYCLYVLAIGGLRRAGLSSIASGAVALAPLSVVSYWLNRKFVFRAPAGN
jgi:putative flippase GtrA